jgi:alpha-tubulin suppressor-like RCC1 family protein
LGDGENEDRSTPNAIEEIEDVKAVTTGGGHTCALTNAGRVLCWGNNSKGQLGDGSNDNRNEPQQVSGLSSGVKAIAAGWNYTCALLDSGNAKCWGDNTYGQIDFNNYALVENPPASSDIPVEIPLLEIPWIDGAAIGITAGFGHVCIITDLKTIECWGANFADQLGRPPFTPFATSTNDSPHEIPPNATFTAVSAGFAHNCGLTTERILFCWGLGSHGQLADEWESVATARLTNVTALATGDHHSCALTEDSKLYCWGKNDRGQVANGADWTPVTITMTPSAFTRKMFLPSVQTEP